jgi:hypothetical protein
MMCSCFANTPKGLKEKSNGSVSHVYIADDKSAVFWHSITLQVWHQPFTRIQLPTTASILEVMKLCPGSCYSKLLSPCRWQQHVSLNTTVKPQSSSIKTQRTIGWSIPNTDLCLYNYVHANILKGNLINWDPLSTAPVLQHDNGPFAQLPD